MDAELVGMSFSDAENRAYYVPVPAEREEVLKIVNRKTVNTIMDIETAREYCLSLCAVLLFFKYSLSQSIG